MRNHRVNGVLAVSRSFGDIEHKGLVAAMAAANAAAATTDGGGGGLRGGGVMSPSSSSAQNVVIALPEVTVSAIETEFEFVVLASDGLWDVFTPQQVCMYVCNTYYLPPFSLTTSLG